VFVHKLRRKLLDASPQWSYIHTKFKVGYRLLAEPAAGEPARVLELAPPALEPESARDAA
jgi:hypothetical protein